MKKLTFAKSLATMGLAAACIVGVVGCAENSSSDAPVYTGGVAATVNGVEIQEDMVTQAIQDIRAQMSLTDEQAWGEWLAENDYTPETVREEIINGYVDQELVKQGSEALGVTANPDEVNEYVDAMKGHYDSDEAWGEALSAVGLTEDEYRENIELSLVSQQLKTKVAEEAAEATDEDALALANEQNYLSSFDGAKKSSHILFDSSDEATAQQVLEKINAGELDFATAAESYSKDTASAADGGNVGWNNLSNFVTEYSDTLATLNVGDVSGLVPSTYGIHIITCTEQFDAPEKLDSLDQLPTEFQDALRNAVKTSNESQAYYTWLEGQRESADIVINEMPEGLPYYVDMANFPKDGADDAAATAVDSEGNPVTIEPEVVDGEGAAEGDQPAGGTEGGNAGDQPTAGAEGDQAAEGKAAEDNQPAEADGDGASQPAEVDQQPEEGAAE
ncbi:MAG: peptidylprolyl isomerase [Enterorhabdus sp.]|jgi:foldase protein PrsA|nr:peptidylprolyl isomerase [Enterorhabdus sp.]